jgi:Flp pilus assembly protein TadB
MIPALLLAVGLGLGARAGGLALAAGTVYFPLPMAGVLALLIWRARSEPSIRSAEFCDALAGELRSGDSLRNALGTAAQSVDAGRLVAVCRSGRPLGEVAGLTAEEFPDIGRELAALIGRAPSGGTPTAELFEEVGSVALAQSAVSHEVSAATASARATAAVLFGVLVIGVGRALGTGGLDYYLESPAQRSASLVGLLLIVGGSGIAVRMLTGSR